MKLSMDMILAQLSKYTVDQVYGTESELSLDSIRLLHRSLTEMTPNYLYMGIAEDIEQISCRTSGITIISAGIPNGYKNIDKDCNLYIFGDADFGQLYNEVQDIFTYYNNWEEKLNNLCSSMANIQELIDVSDEIVSYPIAVVDCAECTIACSQNKNCDDLLWKYIQEGYIKTEYLVRDNIRTQDILHYRSPIQLYTEASNRYILFSPVVVHRNTVAFVTFMMAAASLERFSRAMEHIITVLTQAVAKRIGADELFGASMGVATEFFWTDLISKKIIDKNVISDRARFLGRNLYEKRRILCITGKQDVIPDYEIRIIRETLEKNFSCFDSCAYEGYAVFIEKKCEEENSFLEKYQELVNWIESKNLICGVSMIFTTLYETADYYKQALAAIRFGQVFDSNKNVCFYSKYISLHILEIVENRIQLRSMLHPYVVKILEIYGEDHYMIDTLYTYLLCERNMSESAKRLHIHRNTLLYRIEQMTDRVCCDLTEPSVRQQIVFSMEIIKYLKKYKQELILTEEK